jgi:hypothetical protein
MPDGFFDLITNTWFEYGAVEGIPQLLDLFDKHSVKATSFGAAVERHPTWPARSCDAVTRRPLTALRRLGHQCGHVHLASLRQRCISSALPFALRLRRASIVQQTPQTGPLFFITAFATGALHNKVADRTRKASEREAPSGLISPKCPSAQINLSCAPHVANAFLPRSIARLLWRKRASRSKGRQRLFPSHEDQ